MADMDFSFLNSPDYGVGGQIKANNASDLSRADTAYRLAEVAQSPSKIALTSAQARKAGAEATTAEAEAAAMQKAQAMMAQGSLGQGASANDPNYNPGYALAQVYNSAGAFNAGAKALEQATKIDEQRANMKRYEGVAKHEQALTDKMHIERFSGMAAGAMESQAAYNNFLMQAPAAGYNVQSLPPDLESAKPMLQTLVNQGMTASQIATQHIAQLRLDAQKEQQKVQNKLIDARISGIQTQIDYTKVRRDDLLKNGGARAEASIEATRELTEQRRQRIALEDLKTAGKTPTNPADIPLKDGGPDAKSLKPGQYYRNGKGQIGKWDGKNMLLVTAQPKAKGPQLVPPLSSAPLEGVDLGDDE